MRSSVVHIDGNEAVIHFLHPHNWNKNTFARIPMSDINEYFQLAPPLYDFYLNEYHAANIIEDRKGRFTFDLTFQGNKICECQCNGYSRVQFTQSPDSRLPLTLSRLLESLYQECLPYTNEINQEEAKELIKLELALYLQANLNNGSIRFLELFKIKQGHYLDLEDNGAKYSWKHILKNVTQSPYMIVKPL